MYLRKKSGGGQVQLQVWSIKELDAIINFFDKYPLLTKKHSDYVLFKQAFVLIKNKEHIALEGLKKIVARKANQNWGISEKLKVAFPDVIAVARPIVKDQIIKDPHWLAGFTSASAELMYKYL